MDCLLVNFCLLHSWFYIVSAFWFYMYRLWGDFLCSLVHSSSEYKHPWCLCEWFRWGAGECFICTYFFLVGLSAFWTLHELILYLVLQAFIQNLALFFTSFFKASLFLYCKSFFLKIAWRLWDVRCSMQVP